MNETNINVFEPINSSDGISTLSGKFCQPCSGNFKNSLAAIFCSTCDEYQCQECSNGHKLYSIMKNHTFFNVNAAVGNLADLKGINRCEKHGKCFEYICKEDDMLCCSACAIFEHRQCNMLEDIENVATDTILGTQLKESLLEEKEKCMRVSKHLSDNEKKNQSQLQTMPATLTALRTSISNNLEEQEINITCELKSVEKKMTKLNQSRLECEHITAQLEKDLEILDVANRLGSTEQIFILQQRFHESFNDLNLKAENIFSKLENMDVSLEVNETLEMLIESENLGRLESERFYRNPVKLQKTVSVDLPQDDDHIEEPLYTGMDFLPDGRLVAVDNYNSKCLIFDESLLLLNTIEISQYPHSVVVISEDEIVITFGGEMKIEFLRISSSNEITQIKTVKTTSQYHSISLKDVDHFVVGLIEGTKPVRIVSDSGKETNFKVHFPVKENSIASYTCAYINETRQIVMSDWHESVVYIIDVNTDTSCSVKDDQIKVPKGLAIGPFNIIFVCSSYTHSLVQISPNGQILSSNKLDFDYPYRICVSRDKTKVAVTNNVAGHRMLQLLKIDI